MFKSNLILICALTAGAAILAAQQTGAPTPSNPPGPAAPKAEMVPPGANAQAAQTSPPAASQGKPEKGKKKQDAAADADMPGKNPTATRDPFVIGPDDGLFIRVWHDADLSGAVNVGPDGMISMQLIHEVRAAGLTAEQLEGVIKKRLSEFINEPDVNVQVIRVSSRTYIIQGQVQRTGVFPLTKPTTVLEALVNGGGFRDFSNTKKIYVLRGSKRIFFNYNDVSKGKHMDQNIEVQNGDQIFVP
jgi:polysaccharide export outer membrane protein